MRLIALFIPLLAISPVFAQSSFAPVSTNQQASSTAAPPYHFPTASERWNSYLNETFGERALLQTAITAAIQHANNTPPEWGQGSEGFGNRYADQFGRLFLQQTIEYGAAAALHHDNRYRACECTGAWHRTAHALLENVTARKPDGSRALGVSRLLGVYGSGMLNTSWYPERYTALGDGVRWANVNYATEFGINIGREFLPDLKRKFWHKHSDY